MIRFIIFCFCILTLFSAVLCEIIPKLDCGPEENKKCTIKDVRIQPCKEALKSRPTPCKFKKNTVAILEVDFVPSFASQNLTGQLYWVNGVVDVPMPGMETSACKTTQCPTVVDKVQTYTYNLKIDSYFPVSQFQCKLLLNGDKEDEEQCCVGFKAKIIN